MSIIQLLYEAATPTEMSPAYRSVHKTLAPFFDQLEKAFSLDFVDAFCRVNGELAGVEARESFAMGFRLGFALAQELPKA